MPSLLILLGMTFFSFACGKIKLTIARKVSFMFPQRLRALRIGRGLSQKQLATELNRNLDVGERPNTQGQIGKWELGKTKPSYTEVKKLAAFFQVSLDYLLAQRYESVELDDLFVSTVGLKIAGHNLTSEERAEVYQLIKGYINGRHAQQVASKKNDDEEISLDI